MNGKRNKLDSVWMDSLSRGECPYGCKLGKDGCQHLDAYLEPEKNRSVAVTYKEPEEIDRMQGSYESYQPPNEQKARDLDVMLRNFGLEEWERSVIIERFVYSLTYSEIMKKYHWTNITYVHRICKQAIQKLRERGFYPRSS